jgi:hypothetical protein
MNGEAAMKGRRLVPPEPAVQSGSARRRERRESGLAQQGTRRLRHLEGRIDRGDAYSFDEHWWFPDGWLPSSDERSGSANVPPMRE